MFISKKRYKEMRELTARAIDLNDRSIAVNKILIADNRSLREQLASYKASEITAGMIRQSTDEAVGGMGMTD